MSDYKPIIFSTTIRYACIYRADSVRGTYYVIADIAGFPSGYRDFIRPRLFQGHEVAECKSGATAPMIVEASGNDCSLSTTLQCARDANIRLDELFVGTTVKLAIDPSLFYLRAIEVNVDQMVKRYDDLCAEYFTGG